MKTIFTIPLASILILNHYSLSKSRVKAFTTTLSSQQPLSFQRIQHARTIITTKDSLDSQLQHFSNHQSLSNTVLYAKSPSKQKKSKNGVSNISTLTKQKVANTITPPLTSTTTSSSSTTSQNDTSSFLAKASTINTKQSKGTTVVMSNIPNNNNNNNELQTTTTEIIGPLHSFYDSLSEKIGKINNDRFEFPELVSGEVPRSFSNLTFKKTIKDGKTISSAVHASGSTIGSTALIAGTTIGAGILALPTATAPAGFLPSSAALCLAWFYMTISGLLIAELSINRMGETGRMGVGVLELYRSSLGKPWDSVACAAYFFLHYAVMVAYLAQGGSNLGDFLSSVGVGGVAEIPGLDQALFASVTVALIYFAKSSVVEQVNNVLVIGVILSFLSIIGLGLPHVDFNALVAAGNQHPEVVVDAFPILFLSLVYQNVVPTVVQQLEGDRFKITNAIITGTAIPLVMFLAWNGVILGSALAANGGTTIPHGLNPIQLLQSEGVGGDTLSTLVSIFSELAVTTSLIGFIYGVLNALTDLTGVPTQGPKFEKWKPALFAGVILPPLFFSLGNPDIFYQALDLGGAFGVSTLFLVIPPIMVWKQRYGDDTKPITVPPMVPFGKIPLGSLWKAAGTLILEQGADKLGVFEFFKHLIERNS